jgi:hypothetical protein
MIGLMGSPFVDGLDSNWPAEPEPETQGKVDSPPSLRFGAAASLSLRFERRLAEGVGNAPTSAMPILFSGQVQPAYICLPSVNWLPGLDLHQHRAV